MADPAGGGPLAPLRRRVEEALGEGERGPLELDPVDAARLLHELEVHRVELERQNKELREAKEELRAARDRYFELYDLAPAGYLALDPAGIILEANLRASLLLGVERERLVGASLAPLLLPGQASALDDHLRDVLRDAGPRVTELVLRGGTDGAPRRVRVESAAVSADEAREPHFRSVLVDVTQRWEAEEALRGREEELLRMQKHVALGRLVAQLAHEYKNLLMGMEGCVAMVLDRAPCPGGPDPCPARLQIEALRGEVERGGSLAARVLAFSRDQEAGLSPVRVETAIGDVEQILDRLLGEGVEVRVERAAPGARVLAREGWIEQVVLNLALNARDAMPRGGLLRLEARTTACADAVELTMTDTGTGMSAETLAHAFEPFFTTKPARAGTGLGLPTVRDLVEQMDGRLEVDSEVGRGTTFRIRLPCTRAGTATSAARTADGAASPGRGTTPRTVLVVEDERLVLRAIDHYLRRTGFRPLLAGSAAEALDLAEREEIDVLLTDVLLPGMGGRELARAVRERHPRAPVLFMSAFSLEQLLAEGLIDPGTAVLEKPFSEEALALRLAEITR